MYKEVHKFWLFDELKRGKTIYCLDRKQRIVYCVNDMRAKGLIGLIKDLDEAPERFELWEETEENDG